MRTHRTWINLVAMLALLMGFVPTSVIASLFAPSCNMVCCAGQPTHVMTDSACAKGCDSIKATVSQPVSIIQSGTADNCNCSITSAPNTSQPDVAASGPSGLQIQLFTADIPAGANVVVGASEIESEPGIYGTDSGPPASWPHYVSLGRAPPVLLA